MDEKWNESQAALYEAIEAAVTYVGALNGPARVPHALRMVKAALASYFAEDASEEEGVWGHFVCPKCGGAYWGTSNAGNLNRNEWVGHCHDQFARGCSFRWTRTVEGDAAVGLTHFLVPPDTHS